MRDGQNLSLKHSPPLKSFTDSDTKNKSPDFFPLCSHIKKTFIFSHEFLFFYILFLSVSHVNFQKVSSRKIHKEKLFMLFFFLLKRKITGFLVMFSELNFTHLFFSRSYFLKSSQDFFSHELNINFQRKKKSLSNINMKKIILNFIAKKFARFHKKVFSC